MDYMCVLEVMYCRSVLSYSYIAHTQKLFSQHILGTEDSTSNFTIFMLVMLVYHILIDPHCCCDSMIVKCVLKGERN